MKRLCIYCGSSTGSDPVYRDAAVSLGEALARARIGLVYGGAAIGLMGAVADTVISHGGEVRGVMPQSLVDKEIAHTGLTELHVTSSMHDRKAIMADLSDGFIAMPGGLGTLEELFESWTWAQLGFHDKPAALFNVGGFFDGLITFLDHACGEGFIKPPHRDMLIVSEHPDDLVTRMTQYQPARIDKL